MSSVAEDRPRLVPDTEPLLAVLAELVAVRGLPAPVRIAHRRTNAYASTFPSETIELECRDGSLQCVHAKFQAGREHADHGHRCDLAYEAAVYEALVAPAGLPMPTWLGAHREATGDVWLFIEHLDAVELDEAADPDVAMVTAARWIGQFHAHYDRVGDAHAVALTRYGKPYYAGWVHRTLQFAGAWRERLPWLEDVARRSERLMGELDAVAPTVIHGEFTPSNVLVDADGVVRPIDWESAAFAPGEIDVVCLTDKWPDGVTTACVDAYAAARWPGGAPADVARRVDLARVYWDFRWLGDRPEWTGSEKVGPRFEHLRATVERLASSAS